MIISAKAVSLTLRTRRAEFRRKRRSRDFLPAEVWKC